MTAKCVEYHVPKVYGVADKAWQVVVGCDPHMLCAPRCWARKTVARIAECQKTIHPERSAFFQVALSADGKQWSGRTFLDMEHLADPLHWRKPALIATGFHGDWGRLGEYEKEMILAMAAVCPQHTFMLLSKCPDQILSWMTGEIPMSNRETCVMGRCNNNKTYGGVVWDSRGSDPVNYNCRPRPGEVANRRAWPGWPLRNVTIGCSVMNQSEADRQREPMAALAAMGWNTHVWHEPAIGPVDWCGWRFIKRLIVGGESGPGARPFVDKWAHSSLDWCRKNRVAFWMKQLGSNPVDLLGKMRGAMYSAKDRKGSHLESLPPSLQVREMPEVKA